MPKVVKSVAKTKPEGEEVVVYADGACKGNPGPSGIGCVFVWQDDYRELSEYLGHGTNNTAELTALLRVFEHTEPGTPLHIFTDSNYAIGMLAKGWRAKANQALIADIKKAMRSHSDVTFTHVRGHQGVVLNERADALANLAVKGRKTLGLSDHNAMHTETEI